MSALRARRLRFPWRFPLGIVVAASLTTSAGAGPRATPEFGETRVFTDDVPTPGQPAGIAVDGGHVYVSTLGVLHRPLSDYAVFVYDRRTRELIKTITIPRTSPVSAMALYGLAVDADGLLYAADMNGRILRIDPGTAAVETYASIPLGAPPGLAAMPFDIVFDEDGNAYVSDQNAATIWKVSPGGDDVEAWFTDPRLAGYLAGPSGIRIDPSGSWLYFTVGISLYPETARQGLLFRLPLGSPPSALDLQRVHAFEAMSFATGIAFGRSGTLYVTLTGPNQVVALAPDGTERRFPPSAQDNAQRAVPFDDPIGLAFRKNRSLLITNSAWMSDQTDRMVVFEVAVRDAGLPLERPVLR